MLVFKKHECSFFLDNFFFFNYENNFSKTVYKVNYISQNKSKIIRDFIYFYALALTAHQFSSFQIKDKLKAINNFYFISTMMMSFNQNFTT